MTLGASLRFDHAFLSVEQEHRIHCMLELTAPPIPHDRQAAAAASGPRDRPLRVDVGREAGDRQAGRRLPGPSAALRRPALDRRVRRRGHARPRAGAGRRRSAPRSRPRSGDLDRAVRPTCPAAGSRASSSSAAVAGGAGPKKVLLLSDGLANVGIDDAGELAKLAHGAADDGVGTTTIGFGDGFDEDLMTGMANEGGGSAYFAPGVDDVPGIFAQEFDDLVALVAQNLSVEIRPDPDAVPMVVGAERVPGRVGSRRHPGAGRRRLRRGAPAHRLRARRPEPRDARSGDGRRGDRAVRLDRRRGRRARAACAGHGQPRLGRRPRRRRDRQRGDRGGRDPRERSGAGGSARARAARRLRGGERAAPQGRRGPASRGARLEAGRRAARAGRADRSTTAVRWSSARSAWTTRRRCGTSRTSSVADGRKGIE